MLKEILQVIEITGYVISLTAMNSYALRLFICFTLQASPLLDDLTETLYLPKQCLAEYNYTTNTAQSFGKFAHL